MSNEPKEIIYLDYNATTPIDERVLAEMMPFLTTQFANANSAHQFGLGAHEAVKAARIQVANLISAEAHEILRRPLANDPFTQSDIVISFKK